MNFDEDGQEPTGDTSSSQSENDDNTEDQSQTADPSENQTEEQCEKEMRDKEEVVRDTEISFPDQSEPGPYVNPIKGPEFTVEEGDAINIEMSTSNQQGIDVEFLSPGGETIFTEESRSISREFQITESGRSSVRITSAAETTREVKSELWSDNGEVGAGGYHYGWLELREGNSVEYFIRQLGDGARPKLYIENEGGTVMREEPVSSTIDGKFTAPETGEYYFRWVNTANITSGNWRWEFTRVSDLIEGTDVDVLIERNYTEEVEVCED
ncbi:hypothetical protein JCM17823_06810 [Halorubrum gandharaense]